MNRIKKALIYAIIFFMPFMNVIDVFNLAKFNLSLSDIFIPVIIIYTIIHIKNIDVKRILKYIILFALLFVDIFISNIFAMNNSNIISSGLPTLIGEEIKIVICAIYFLTIIIYCKDKELFKNCIKIWLISCICICIIGLIALIMYYCDNPLEINTLVSGAKSVSVFIGTFTDQNLSAVYLSISFYIALFYLKISPYKKIGYVTLIICPLCIFLTASRGGMIGFCCSVIFYMLISLKYYYKKLIIIIPFICLIFIAAMSVDINFMDMNISTNLFDKMKQVATKSGEFTVRVNLSKAAFKIGNDNFLLGIGRGNYPLNSPKYFEDMGLDSQSPLYKDKIPHNTILGIYSELGIIGISLYIFVFLYLLYLIFKNIKFKGYIEYQLILISMYCCIFIESIPLNLENFRGLWIITAIFIVLEQNLLKYLEPLEQKEFKLSYNHISIAFIIFLVVCVIYIDNARKFYIENDIVVKDNKNIEIDNFINSKEQYIKYCINTKSENPDIISTSVKVIGIDNKNNKNILAQYNYWKAKGTAKLYFTPDENIKSISLSIENKTGEPNCTIKDIYMGLEGNEKPILNQYPLIPDKMFKLFASNNLILHNKEIISKPELWNKELDYNFGDKVILKSVENKLVNGKYEIEFVFRCIDKIDRDYIMWLHGIPDNINYLNQDRIQHGFDNFDNRMEIPMSAWEVGKEYIHKYTLQIEKGSYELSFGLCLGSEYLRVNTEIGLYVGNIDIVN